MTDRLLYTVLRHLRKLADPAEIAVLSDGQLVQRFVAQRDQSAFEVLVWRHGSTVFNVCRRVLHHQQDAEDAFQATFLVFARKASAISQRHSVGSWLYKVAFRLALAARTRASRRSVAPLPHEEFPAAEVGDDREWSELRPILDEEISRLPDKYRRPVRLCYLEGKTTHEAARELGCPRGTVGTRLAWARERLRNQLSRRGVTLSAAALMGFLASGAQAASVPATLIARTVQSGLAFVSNPTAAGIIPAPVLTLAKGGLHAMLLTKLKIAAVFTLTLGVLGLGAGLWSHQAWAEPADRDVVQEKPAPPVDPNSPEEAIRKALEELKLKPQVPVVPPARAEDGRRDRPERDGDAKVRRPEEKRDGDAPRREADVNGRKDGDKPRPVADPVRRDGDVPRENAEKGKVDDRRNIRIKPSLSAVVQAVDADKNTITVGVRRDGDQGLVEETYNVNKDAEILLDGVKRTLADVPMGSQVGIFFLNERRQVSGIRGEGPSVRGVVRAVDADKNTLTLAGGDDTPDRTFTLAADLKVMTPAGDERPAQELKLTEVRAGTTVNLKLSIDRKQVRVINLFRGDRDR